LSLQRSLLTRALSVQDEEKAVLASVLKPDRCYVTDRGYAKFELFNQINATDHQVSYIEVEVAPHVLTGRGGNNCDGRLRLVTNLMDVPAELIAEACRLQRLIELFFRMMKQLLPFWLFG